MTIYNPLHIPPLSMNGVPTFTKSRNVKNSKFLKKIIRRTHEKKIFQVLRNCNTEFNAPGLLITSGQACNM